MDVGQFAAAYNSPTSLICIWQKVHYDGFCPTGDSKPHFVLI